MKYTQKNSYTLCLFFFLLFSIFSCVRNNDATSAEIHTLRSGSLAISSHKDAPETIFIDMHDASGHTALSTRNLEAALRSKGFRIVNYPSHAGYILHITLLQEGKASPDALRRLVNTGYGKESKFTGSGTSAWLADALLVQRRVPTASRENRARLKNISAQNALGSAQMRLAIFSVQDLKKRSAFSGAYAATLAREITNAISGGK